MAAVIGFLYTALAILVRGSQIVADRVPHFSNVKAFQWNFGALFALPIVVFGFNCHANVVTIFTELKKYPEVLIRNMPEEPHQYATLPISLAPRPRTHKLIGDAVGHPVCHCAHHGRLPCRGLCRLLCLSPDCRRQRPQRLPPERRRYGGGAGCHRSSGGWALPFEPPPGAALHAGLGALLLWLGVPVADLLSSSDHCLCGVVTDLGSVLHMVGGTAAAFMIFFLPGLLLINAAIIKESAEGESSADPLLGTGETGGVAPVLPVVASPNELGIKRRGFIYSPRKSWWTGVFFVGLAITILIITLVTAVVPYE
eukprot:jgi/Botrbrau1/19789/Bobra.0124s0037.1